MSNTKCVHTVAIDDWRPDLCAITIPNLRAYADRIGADFNIISKAKFQGYPPNYERLQVYEDGKGYAWNICIDADTILHRGCEDPTSWMNPKEVGSLWMTDAKWYFKWNDYFERDGRNIGVADSFVISSHLTHDVWTPLDVSFEEARKSCLRDERMVSEYALSQNIARYGLGFNGALKDHSKHYSIMTTTHKVRNPAEMMLAKLAEWEEFKFLESIGMIDRAKALYNTPKENTGT